MKYRAYASTLMVSLLAAAPALAQRSLLNVPPPDVTKELAAFTVAEGFEVNLFAADPMVANPIHMNWDAAGRLWIVGSTVYPQIAPGQPTSDTITILEDTDHDGVADKSTLFADNLFIPTGIAPGDGGVYVCNSTELLHLKDTDGDGRADHTRVVLSGFGTEDTHQIVHSPRWGYDGLLYFNQSIYIHSHIETPHGVRRLNAGGIWQFRPETMELEVFVRGFVNPWGHDYDVWGQSFATDGAYHEGINYVFPGAAFITVDGIPRILKGLNEGMPKHCSLEILGGRHLPEDWRGSMVTNDFRGQRVCRFVVTEEADSYVSVEQPAVLKSTHVSFRPVDVRMGPDGAIYIADWYNPIIQHGEVDFRDPRRDHEHGRIWRITAKGRPLVEAPKIVGAPIEDLVALLRSPEPWNRTHAKRELKTRDQGAVLAALENTLAALNSSDPEFEQARLELLWTWQTLDVVNKPLLEAVLASPDHRARAAAVRVLAQWKGRMQDDAGYLATLSPLVEDPHTRVRIEAVRALSLLPEAAAADTAMRVMAQPMDRFLEYALWTTMRDLKAQWLPLLESGALAFAAQPDALLYALNALDSPEAVAPLLRFHARQGITPAQQRSALAGIANHGDAAALGNVVSLLLQATALAPEERAGQMQDLIAAAKRRGVRPEGDLAGLEALIDTAPDVLRAAAIAAAGAWQIEAVRPTLEKLALDDATPPAPRGAALDALAALGGAPAVTVLENLASGAPRNDVRIAANRALLQVAPERAAVHAVALLGAMEDQDPAPVYQPFLQADGGTAALVKALEGAAIPAQIAKLGVRVVSSSGRDEPALLAALRTAGGLEAPPTEMAPERMAELVEAVNSRGDAARGYTHYRTLDCAQCHAIAGGGGNLGPDMTSIGGSAQVDYLIESLLFPAKAVKDGYHAVVIETSELETFSGIKTGQTDSELILRNATEPEIRIPVDTITSQADGGSLMPTGLTEPLLEEEFIDLVRFLSELGRTPAFSVDTARRARTWRVLSNTTAAVDYLYEAQPEAALQPHETLTWLPAYSHVDGTLPLDEVPVLAHRYWVTQHSFLQCTIEAATAGRATLAANNHEGTRLWVNGTPVALGAATPVDLPAGASTCTVIVDRSVAKGAFELRLVDDPASTVTAKFTGGR
jgi:putative heme-binding domain-containing protein